MLSSGLRAAAVLLLAVAAALAIPGGAVAQGTQFHAVLFGANEVPPVTTAATGTFTLSIDGATGTFTLNVPSV
jgi:hypothetical protein